MITILVALAGVVLAFYFVQQAQGETVVPDMANPFPPRTGDPFTNKVWELCYAIAFAEGFGVKDSVPTRFHNPGDLGPGDTGFPGESHGGSVVSVLPDDETGWQFLFSKMNRALSGQSDVYQLSETFMDWAHHYAGDYTNWAKNVAQYLGVTTDTRVIDWLNS